MSLRFAEALFWTRNRPRLPYIASRGVIFAKVLPTSPPLPFSTSSSPSLPLHRPSLFWSWKRFAQIYHEVWSQYDGWTQNVNKSRLGGLIHADVLATVERWSGRFHWACVSVVSCTITLRCEDNNVAWFRLPHDGLFLAGGGNRKTAIKHGV